MSDSSFPVFERDGHQVGSGPGDLPLDGPASHRAERGPDLLDLHGVAT